MKGRKHRCRSVESGMTLTEVVIALGIMAISIPLILAAKSTALKARSVAELETRSAWVARQVKLRIMEKWSSSYVKDTAEHMFPTEEQPYTSMTMIYRKDGVLVTKEALSSEHGDTLFLITIESKHYENRSNQWGENGLALTQIEIQHPIQAPKNQRKCWAYQFISRKGE